MGFTSRIVSEFYRSMDGGLGARGPFSSTLIWTLIWIFGRLHANGRRPRPASGDCSARFGPPRRPRLSLFLHTVKRKHGSDRQHRLS